MKDNVGLAIGIGMKVWEIAAKDGVFSRDEAVDRLMEKGWSVADATRAAISGEWYDNGLPRIVVGHRHAASLMCTSMSPSDVPHLVAPWTSFLIDVPQGMLMDPNGEPIVALLCVDITESETRSVSCIMLTDSTEALLTMISVADSVEELARENRREHPSAQLAARLMAGAIAELSVHREAPSMGRDRSIKRDPRGNPVTRTFVITRPVSVDCRPAVASYLSGERTGAPAVQVLVRGHWRWQAHSVGWSQRRWRQIEPHWRGPEDAPIALRPHVLKGPGTRRGASGAGERR